MPYLLAAVFALGFGSGFMIESWLVEAEIQRLQLSIQAGNAEAKALLTAATDRVNIVTAAAVKSNLNLDAAHESAIQTINAYRDQLATAKLRDPGSRSGCPGTLPVSHPPGLSPGSADPGQLSAEFTGFLRREAYRADHAAELYARCRTFALIDNCGIAK